MKKPTISAIAAIGQHRELGKAGRLIWPIAEDLKHFREITIGHPIIMGRKTFESIGKALPGRTNIVVTRGNDLFDGATTVHTVEEAIEHAKQKDGDEIFIIGGQQIYEAALPYTERLYLTLIEASADADTFFPPYERLFTKIISKESRAMHDLKYSWVILEK